MNTAEAHSAPRAAIALYVALAVHALLLLALALGPQSQDSAGRGIGIIVAGDGLDELDRRLASAPPMAPAALIEPMPATSAAMATEPVLETRVEQQATPEPAQRTPVEPEMRRAAQAGGGGTSTYFARLRMHLTKFRRELPPEWRGARARVALELGANGEVSDIALAESSGLPDFDAEALALVQRAAPMPAPPGRRSMRVVIPIAINDRD